MAAAEARAAWQRMANRCFVQEDAKRAPKLACCPSSSSSKPESDMGPDECPNEQDHPSAGFRPLNWNPSNSNLPPDTKWWLQLQPNFAYQKDFTYEQLDALEAELEVLRAGEVNKTSELGESHLVSEDDFVHVNNNKNSGSYLDPLGQAPATCMMHDTESKMQQLKTLNINKTQDQVEHKDGEEYWYGNEGLDRLALDPSLLPRPSKKLCSDLESPWMRAEKTEPWWRTVDKDNLASLVALKSLEHIENCDLPRPQMMHVSRGPFTCFESFDRGSNFSSFLDQKANIGLSNPGDYSQCSRTSGSAGGSQVEYCESGHSIYCSERLFSSSNGHIGTNEEPLSESDPSKAQLLEALCHSQTRAREAEKAAQQAYIEKEHIIKLFFRQASHLFAYKQWFQLLQLETICLQLKNKDQTISTLLPAVLPWMPYKGKPLKKRRHKGVERKRGAPKCHISKYAVAFAVGLGLASAGLLLGWTMGWLLPTI